MSDIIVVEYGAGGGGACGGPEGPGSCGVPRPGSDERELSRDIAIRWLRNCLLRIDFDDCKAHGGVLPEEIRHNFYDEVTAAAREMKAAGIGWEEWT